MPGTFSQIYIQIVFAVKYRQSLIDQSWEDDLYKYITGIVKGKGQKLIAINGMPDHIHIFIGLKPSCCISDLVREIKKASDEYIKSEKFTKCKFQWQEGFGAFSYSHTSISNVANYIENQKNHHKKTKFRDEYHSLLKEFEVEYEERFLFEWILD
jgi:REP element-mobilizing transposase RayT